MTHFKHRLPIAGLLVALAAQLLSACAQGDIPCRVGADCPSGVCLIDGVCQPLDDAGAEPDAGGADAGTDAGSADAGTPDGAVDAGTDAGPEDGGVGCGDADGTLTRAELPLPLSVAVVRRVALSTSVDTVGATRGDGTRLWDFEGPFSGDADRTDQRMPLDGQWFADDFAGGTYTLPLSADDDLLGVFQLNDNALLLLGVVSPDDGAFRTELEYDPPAPVWRFPLRVGETWEETSSVSGVLNGVLSAYSETWSVAVDASGDVGTPAGVRSVLRVNTELTRTVGVVVTRSRRHAYVEECVGTVAQVFGVDGDTSAEPAMASELWRVAP